MKEKISFGDNLLDKKLATLTEPDTKTNDLTVVGASGVFGTREMGLPKWADALKANGIRSIMFDYSRFGESGGTPRQVLDYKSLIRDWNEAIDFAQKEYGDVGILGWSYAPITKVMGQNPDVKKGSTNTPFADALSYGSMLEFNTLIANTFAGLRSYLKEVLLGMPDMVPVFSDKDEVAYFDTRTETGKKYAKMSKDDPNFINLGNASELFRCNFNKPLLTRLKKDQEMLITHGLDDEIVNRNFIKLLRWKTNAKLVEFEGGHCDVFDNKDVINANIEFFSNDKNVE